MSAGPAGATLDVVCFGAGGCRLGVAASQVRAELPDARGRALLPVEPLFGLRQDLYASLGAERVLLIAHAGGTSALQVTAPLQLQRLEAQAIFPLPPLVQACITLPAVRALALTTQGVVVLVDLQVALAGMDRAPGQPVPSGVESD